MATSFFGHIGKDATTKYVESLKTTVTDFSIAENYKDRKGENHTQWYNVSIWDKRGKNMEQYLKSGRPLGITGRVKGKGYLTQDIVDRIKAGEDWKKIAIPCQLYLSNPQVQFVTGNEVPAEAPADVDESEMPL